MKYIIHHLAIETTRRCNLKCSHCMRGECQNIDISKEIIDMILNNEEIEMIEHICFSGGEPTLNPNVIIYAIDKIIEENINVQDIAMVTNGQIFNLELVEAFNRFNSYVNEKRIRSITERYSGSESLETLIRNNTDRHARITFSTDKYHHPIPDEVRKMYRRASKGLSITETDVKDEDIYKTGFAKEGKEFDYALLPLKYYKEGEHYYMLDCFYVTSTGFITSEGMGQYTDMDKINMGHISNTTITEILANYGTPVLNTPKIEIESSKKK